MSAHRLKIEGIGNAETVYTGWIESVLVRGENQEVYITFSPRFKRFWVQTKKRMLDYLAKNPANTRLRSKYALRLYSWAKKNVKAGTADISLEDLRGILDLQSVKDADGNVIHEAPLPVWANFRQRALDVAILKINANTDLKIKLSGIERAKHRRVVALNFLIKTKRCPRRERTSAVYHLNGKRV
jgi:plasmid replication initiation protein